ncbi:MAG: hypothetical protein IKQ11_05285 [Paludibacteraceae bacterium]|nr:hypothetical protein [Paludibacteraceae bacterium]
MLLAISHDLEFTLMALMFVLIGLMLVSFFLVWHWFDASDRLKVVREVTREQTMHEIHHSHNRCRILLGVGLLLALCYIPIPFVLDRYYNTLVYPGVVILADTLILVALRLKVRDAIADIDEYVNANEEHVREAIAEVKRVRDEWRKEAAVLNPQAKAQIAETMGDNYDVWYQHDILLGRNVLANVEAGLLYAQGVVIPFAEIMEVRKGRRDLKLVTNNSMHPFITIDFGALPINPETGNKYLDEIADKIEAILP